MSERDGDDAPASALPALMEAVIETGGKETGDVTLRGLTVWGRSSIG